MKKICFIGFNLFTTGGCQKITVSLCNNLCSQYETHIMSLCKILDPKNYNPDEKLHIHSFDMPLELRARTSLSSAHRLKKFLDEKKIDVLFIAGTLPIPIVALIKPFIKCKVVFCDHENLFNRDKKSVFFRRFACKMSDKVVVLTNQTLKEYIRLFHIKKDKISCIYNYADDNMHEGAGNYNHASKKIITVGRISEEKGFDMLVDVAKIVLERHKDWQWHIWGDGEKFGHIKSLIEKNNLQDRLILQGQTQDIYDKYKDYSLYVLTSYREGLPLVLLEAKANRLPIVSFDCTTGPREIVCDGQDGFLIPCYDKQMMAEKICTLIEDSSLRERFSENSQNNINKFDKGVILQQWRDLIEEVSGK